MNGFDLLRLLDGKVKREGKKRKAVEEKRIKKMVPTDLHLSVDNVLESKFSSMRGAVVHQTLHALRIQNQR